VKQCDENCGDTCDNSRIYISNLPPDVTTDELRDLFGGIGQVIFLFFESNTWIAQSSSELFVPYFDSTFCNVLLMLLFVPFSYAFHRDFKMGCFCN